MRIIIAPAKKMAVEADVVAPTGAPPFVERAQLLLDAMRRMSRAELQAMWRCNDAIAELNFERLRHMDLAHAPTPALLSYVGIQYQYMAPGVFTVDEFAYAQAHVRILSGFYGLLRPLDGVTPYRLEMQARLRADGCANLYEFWGDRLAARLESEDDAVLNLASAEYSLAVTRHLSRKTRLITCAFCEWKDGRLVEKGTLCKMARGDMVRFLAENRLTRPEDARGYERLGFRYHADLSDERVYRFVRDERGRADRGGPSERAQNPA